MTRLRVTTTLLASALVSAACTLAGDGGSPTRDPTAPSEATAAAHPPSEESGTPPASEESGTPPASEQPPRSADPAVSAPQGFLPPGSIVRVTADGVRIRAEPTTSADQLTTIGAGQLLGLGPGPSALPIGPVQADGHAWYPVVILDRTELPPLSEGPLVAASTVGWVVGEYVELQEPRCALGDPDLEILSAQAPWERYACVGDRSITFEGTYGCPGCGGALLGIFEPIWLASPLDSAFISVEPGDRIGPMTLRFPDGGPDYPDGGSILRVTGHYADPAAAGCVYEPHNWPAPTIANVVELYCQIQFVVETYEVIGFDDNFLDP